MHLEPAATNQSPDAGRGPSAADFDILDAVRVVWRRKRLVIGTTLLLTVIVAVVTLLLTPYYRATAHVMIDPVKASLIEAADAVDRGSSIDAATVESAARVMQSRQLADRVVSELHLYRYPEFNGTLSPPGLVERLLAPAREALAAGVSDAMRWIGSKTRESASGSSSENAARARIVDRFLARLDVRVEGQSRVIAVTFRSTRPETAAKVANTIADTYILMQLEAKFAKTRTVGEWLNKRLDELRRKVEASEAAVERYRADHALVANRNTTITTEEASNLTAQLADARAQRAQAEAQLSEAQSALLGTGGAATISKVLDSNLIQQLRAQEVEIQRAVSDMSQNLGHSHPNLVSARAQLAEVRAEIKAEVEKITQQLKNEVLAAETREATLSEALNQIKERAGAETKMEVALRALEREATANRTMLETFLARAQETSSHEDYQEPDAHVVSRADAPGTPVYPKKGLIIVSGFFAAGVFSVLLAYLVELRDAGFRSEEEIEQVLGVASLAMVPTLKQSWLKKELPTTHIATQPDSIYVESIRRLWNTLRISNGHHTPRVILVASSLPDEGKTTLVISLASLLSSTGLRVLVVDTDLRKPSVDRTLGLASEPGLLNYLHDRPSLTSIIQHDSHTGIDVIAAGGPRRKRVNLGPDQLRELLGELQSSYDVIVLDSAPLLAASETMILVGIADKTIFLIRWADTRRHTAVRGFQQVVQASSSNSGVNVVLTMADLRKCAKYGYGEFARYYRRLEKYYAA